MLDNPNRYFLLTHNAGLEQYWNKWFGEWRQMLQTVCVDNVHDFSNNDFLFASRAVCTGSGRAGLLKRSKCSEASKLVPHMFLHRRNRFFQPFHLSTLYAVGKSNYASMHPSQATVRVWKKEIAVRRGSHKVPLWRLWWLSRKLNAKVSGRELNPLLSGKQTKYGPGWRLMYRN